MSSSTASERRQFPRFNVHVPLSLSVYGAEHTETVHATVANISLNGVYCTVNRYLPLFDKILITFVLPEKSEDVYHLVSQCEGVVVRVEPEEEEPECSEYQVALYFNNLSGAERNLLQTIISTYS
jgi:c-di-GMP-binding flagellar brake protein YcgR